MFYSYDLSNFGIELRSIRQKNGYTQNYVKEHTGVNEDTLRRIENGTVIPKYETLEILSSLYKTDLLLLLQTHRRDKHFYDYYRWLDQIIANNDIHLLVKLTSEYKKCIHDDNSPSFMINNAELKQFELLLLGIKLFNSDDQSDHKNTVDTLTNALKLTISDFSIINFKNYSYNLLEIRILFLLGLLKEKCNDRHASSEILKYVLTYLVDNSEFDEDVQKIVIKCYCNISYNFHRIDDDISALNYANAGIDFCVKNSNLNCLYLLYARKGVAEFFLKEPNYIDALTKSIHLLQINKQFDLAELYTKTFKEKYNVSIN
jgi:transcriptional regulator with XRE-family HTH domain